jgi:hypothetical protein
MRPQPDLGERLQRIKNGGPTIVTANEYRPTESQHQGGAKEMYVTYDLDRKTRGRRTATYPKVKRVYIGGDVTDWAVGDFTKRTGRHAHGVQISHRQARRGFERERTFTQVVDLPEQARNIMFHEYGLPAQYQAARQDVR